MTLLWLLCAYVVDLPPFGGTTDTTLTTGDTGAADSHTGQAPTGETGGTTTTGDTADIRPTGDTGAPPERAFSNLASAPTDVISPALLPIATISLDATAAPIPGAGPAGEDTIWLQTPEVGIQRVYLDGSGVEHVELILPIPVGHDSLHGASTPDGGYLLLQNNSGALYVYDGQGNAIGELRPFQNGKYGDEGDCNQGLYAVTVLPSFDLSSGDDVVCACYEDSGDGSLRSLKLSDFSEPKTPLRANEVVNVDAYATGEFGRSWRALMPRAHISTTQLWVGDHWDGYDPQRVHLIEAPPRERPPRSTPPRTSGSPSPDPTARASPPPPGARTSTETAPTTCW